MSEWLVPLSNLEYDEEEEGAALAVLRSRWLSMGAEVDAFEREFSGFIGSRYTLAVANGTAALHIALQALNVGPGDEVIQPALSFVAAANMTVACGATPVFADVIGIDEPTIDPAAISRAITARTKAIVVMHYGGYLSRMAEIVDIARSRRIPIIEDACHAVGAAYLDAGERQQQRDPHGLNGMMAGNLGAIGCFSFFSNKNLATGEGGMATTNDESLAAQMRLLRSHGMTTLTWDRHRGHAHSYDVVAHGHNFRLDELHAALGRVQLRKLAKNNERRKHLVSLYRERLNALAGWRFPFENYQGESAFHLAVVVAPDEDARTRAIARLAEARIQTSIHYPCITDFKTFASCRTAPVPNSRMYAHRALTLPLFPSMTEAQVEQVASVLLDGAR